MKKYYSKDEIEKVNNLDIVEIAKNLGFDLERTDKKSFKCKNQGGLYIYSNNNKFYHFSNGESGGVISFVQKVKGINFLDALEYLGAIEEDRNYNKENNNFEKIDKKDNEKMYLPKRDENDKKLLWYLINERKIDKEIVFKLLKTKKIYQDTKKNIVFLGKDTNGVNRYANLRGTNANIAFKGDVKNSDKSYGFILETKNKDNLVVVESPIDAISYLALKTIENNFFDSTILSLGGLSSREHLERYLSENDVKKITFALDNDYLARNSKKELCNWGQNTAKALLEKYSKNYSVENEVSVLKDWNEDLIQMKNGLSKEQINEIKEQNILEDIKKNDEDFYLESDFYEEFEEYMGYLDYQR